MPLPPPKRHKNKTLDLPPAPPLSVDDEFKIFLEQNQSWEAVYFFEMNRQAEDLRQLGLGGRAYKSALKARSVDLESSMGGRLEVPEHLRELWDEHYAEMTRPAREKIERAADEQIRREQNQKYLERLNDLHERGALQGHPLEPIISKLFLEKEQDNGTE